MKTVAVSVQDWRRKHPCSSGNGSQLAVHAAIDDARNLAKSWPRTPPETRAKLVSRLSGLLASQVDIFAELMAKEIGKPVRFGRAEVERTVEMLGAVTRRSEHCSRPEVVGTASVRRRAHGVVAVITPWNNPIYLALGKIIPAILYGNTVVWKPAPEAQSVSGRLLECLDVAGWPEGLVNALHGGHREAEDLMNEPSVAAVTITGSLSAGDCARAICSRRHVSLQAELGGNNAAIVWPDADLRAAAQSVAAGTFEMAGQRCTANRRVIVMESCRARFLPMLLEETPHYTGAIRSWSKRR